MSARNVFYIVGPTASGKSELAAEVAQRVNGEIVSADAFQVYRGFDLLPAKPDGATLSKCPHHMIGVVDTAEEMNVARFLELAQRAIADIHSRGKLAVVVGGTGLYVRALTHGLSAIPASDPELRERLSNMQLQELLGKLDELDPDSDVDRDNPRRVIRAIEICMATGRPASAQRKNSYPIGSTPGFFVFRERDDLYARIDRRVEEMFAAGVEREVRDAGAVSATASQMLGLTEIQALNRGEISRADCIAKIQQATRHYAKRQLTWFRRQDNFETLNLTGRTTAEAIELIEGKARLISR